MSVFAQRNFAGGEISPSLYGRNDTVKYQTGLKTARNWMVRRDGAIMTRPGTKFVCETHDPAKKCRLIPFRASTDDTYVVVLSEGRFKFIKSGAQILKAAAGGAISSITQANPAVVTMFFAHGLASGDQVELTGVGGMTQVFGRTFRINVTGAATFELRHLDNVTGVDSTAFSAFTSGGTVRPVYEITSPYLEADYEDISIRYAQSRDTIILTHPLYAPRELKRISDTSWTLTTASFVPSVTQPAGILATPATPGAFVMRYRATALKDDTLEESLPSNGTSFAVTGFTVPATVNFAAVPTGILQAGDEVYISGLVGITGINDAKWTITSIAGAGPYTAVLTGAAGAGVWTSGGTMLMTHASCSTASMYPATPAGAANWTDVVVPTVSGASQYNFYRSENGVMFGYVGTAYRVGSSTTVSFRDYGLEPDYTIQPPSDPGYFASAGNWPTAVTYYQQRILYGGSVNEPETVWGSRIGAFKSFSSHIPVNSDDAIKFALTGREVNSIQHLLGLRRFIVFTAGGILVINGDGGIILPTAINPEVQTYSGAGDLAPVPINDGAIYLQARGNVVRDLVYDDSMSYRSSDLTAWASHLVDGFTLRDWAYSQIPHSTVWAARDDGALLALTYLREQEILGWSRHDFTAGEIEQVCVVPEGAEDVLYTVVKYTIPGLASLGGATRRYVLRMATRLVGDLEDYVGMDAALTYDGRNGSGTMTLTLDGAPDWTYTSTLKLTASVAATFTAADVGNAVVLHASNGDRVKLTITAYNSGTEVHGKPDMIVPTTLRALASDSWDKAVDQIGGLWHLEGKSVSVLADGFVAGSPNNAQYAAVTVADGIVTLDDTYSVVHVGLPMLADIESLDIDTTQGGTMADKAKLVTEMTVMVEETLGLWGGTRPPADDDVDPLGDLQEIKVRDMEANPFSPVAMQSGKLRLTISGTWNNDGHMFLRVVDPVPATVLMWAPSGFRGGGP